MLSCIDSLTVMFSCRYGACDADHVLGDQELVVVLVVHEVETVTIFIEVVEIAVLDERAFDLIGGLVASGDLYAVADPAHFDLADRSSLAGVDVLRRQDDI